VLPPLVVLDTESATTRGAPHLLELGAVRVEDGEVTARFETLVRPLVAIEAEATGVHGIDEAAVRDAPLAPEALADFGDWLCELPLAAHAAARDAGVLAFECARHGVRPPGAPILDTLALARRCIPEAPDHRLDTLIAHLDLEESGRHRALADAVYAWKVLEECAERLRRSSGAARVGWAELVARAGGALSFAGAAPLPPRMSPRLRPLEAAIREEAEVQILYGAGPEPPVALPVRPRFLYQRQRKGYLEGECSQSGLWKTYRLERVHKVLR